MNGGASGPSVGAWREDRLRLEVQVLREPKAGGGATRLGNDVKDCPSVPKEVKAFFARELDKIKERKRERERQRHRSTAAARTQYVDLENEDDDPELQAAIHQSREEYEFRERAGARYERGGGSGSGQAGPLPRMLRRSQTQVPERVKDYHLLLALDRANKG